MAKTNRRFYWLQLAQSFFKSKEMKLLRKMPGGDTYTIIYLKLMLISLEDDGNLFYDGLANDLAEELSLLIDEDTEAIRMTLMFLEKKGLMTKSSSNVYFLEQVPEMVGSETASARRVRKHRDNQKALQSNNGVTNSNGEIEIDIKKEKDIKKDKEKDIEYTAEQSSAGYVFPDWLDEKYVEQVKKGNPKNYEIRIPIAYLNQVTGSNYKFVDANTNLVKARFNDKYTLDDFKKVIDTKFTDWGNDPQWSKYLRPSTLFNATKFESYLNSQTKVFKPNSNIPDWSNPTIEDPNILNFLED
ncbi:TPA: conserved phage C-terminal domain-containing protein [Streptococcus agalactiae]|nr:conserved phage C-terminal domain-containing protein [Streptococcus agalactiae]HEO7923674.1 conserved phage C-terminal domain-containing protein [Streptococcus agalactiae]